MRKEINTKKTDTLESLAEMINDERNRYIRRVVILQDKVKDLEQKLSDQDIYIVKDGNEKIIACYRDFGNAMTHILEHNNSIIEGTHTEKVDDSELINCLQNLKTAKFVD